MTRRVGNIIIIESEEPRKCELCGKKAECRPYGPGGKQICWDCAQPIMGIVEKQMGKRLFGEEDE